MIGLRVSPSGELVLAISDVDSQAPEATGIAWDVVRRTLAGPVRAESTSVQVDRHQSCD
jgi:hypothetical protein